MKTLSTRQKDIARLVAQGRTNAEIADELFLAVQSVKNYVSQICLRFECRNRVELAVLITKQPDVLEARP